MAATVGLSQYKEIQILQWKGFILDSMDFSREDLGLLAMSSLEQSFGLPQILSVHITWRNH